VDRGTDVLLTTQYLDEADHLANRIVIIDHGRSVAAGTPAELKQRAGKSVIEVHVRDRKDLARVAAILARLDHGAPQVEESTRRVSVAVEAGPGSLRDALQALDAADAVVDDLSLRPPTLDEVFLALTGAPLDAVGSDPMPRPATAPPAA
jgi:ABC-2 type transport system ATP-binding protein